MPFWPFQRKTTISTRTAEFQHVVPKANLVDAFNLQDEVQQIADLVSVTTNHFDYYYLTCLQNFIQVSQFAPTFVASQTAAAVAALKLRRQVILPPGVEPEYIRRYKDLWTYIVFVTSLLYQSGPHILCREIVYKESPHSLASPGRWNPLVSILHPPAVYRVQRTDSIDSVAPLTTLFFLKICLPEPGLNWLSVDIKTFNTVCRLVTDPPPESSVGALILKAHGQYTRPEDRSQSLASDDDQEKTPDLPTQSRRAPFVEWLKQHVKNADPTQCTFFYTEDDRLNLITPAIFKQYAKQHPCNWKDIQAEFLKMGYHEINSKNSSNFHTVVIPGRGNVNVLILKSL